MKTTKKVLTAAALCFVTLGMVFNFSGCSKDSPLQSRGNILSTEQDFSLAKKPSDEPPVYPIWGKANFYNNKKDGYTTILI